MEDSIHAYVIARLQAAKGHWPAVAKGSGVPLSTVRKVAMGSTKTPRIHTIEGLARFFREQDARGKS